MLTSNNFQKTENKQAKDLSDLLRELTKAKIKFVKFINNSQDHKKILHTRQYCVQENGETFVSLFKDLQMENKIGVHCSAILRKQLHHTLKLGSTTADIVIYK